MGVDESTSLIQQQAAIQSAQALQIRLQTTGMLREVESFLRGHEIIISLDANGKEIATERQIGEPLANKQGQQMLLMWMRTKVNSATVQGNISGKKFDLLIAGYYEQLTDDVFLNKVSWGIAEENLQFIVATLMDLVELFLSRTIDNMERLLFGTTKESYSSKEKAGFSLGGIKKQ